MPQPKKPKETRGVVAINIDLCKGCGFCVEFCPADVLEVSGKFNSKGYYTPRIAKANACNGCNLCGMYCPEFAIFGTMKKYVA
ncbi:MAG TPA: 4Fe-4S dicluster domain-containing protein [Acidobacteriota bacterium]|nr:4Fe-4S dicluster domain-containing protein [Acidobacteriota bacterium]